MNTIHKLFFYEVNYILMTGLASKKKKSTKQNDGAAIHLFWR